MVRTVSMNKVNCMLESYSWRARTWGRGNQTLRIEKKNFSTFSAIFIVLPSKEQRWKSCFANLLSLQSPFSCSLKWKRFTNKKICPLVDLAQLQSLAGQEQIWWSPFQEAHTETDSFKKVTVSTNYLLKQEHETDLWSSPSQQQVFRNQSQYCYMGLELSTTNQATAAA